jgi:hypothetical protein
VKLSRQGEGKLDYDYLEVLARKEVTQEAGASIPSGVMSFRAHLPYRAWQGAAYWDNHIVVTTDRSETFALKNIITVYDLSGNKVSELQNAYTGLDSSGRFMSFGSPSIINGYLYLTVYNINGGASNPADRLSRVLRYTLDPTTRAVALDTSFGVNGAVEIGGYTAEHVTLHDGKYFVCYDDQQLIRLFNEQWLTLGTVSLSGAALTWGGCQAMVWEGETVYLNYHGPNNFGLADSRKIEGYTWNGSSLTLSDTLTPPAFGTTQGFSAAPWGYVWADRPANRIVYTIGKTPGALESSPRSKQVSLFKPTLLNSWVAHDATYDRTAKVWKDADGIVHLEGMIKGGTATAGTCLFAVPEGYRPTYSKNFPIVSNGAFGYLAVVGVNNIAPADAGKVVLQVGSNAWVSLDGINWLSED